MKPQFGSNGVGVVRVVSREDRLAAESDCQDTAWFLDEFPADPATGATSSRPPPHNESGTWTVLPVTCRNGR